MESNPVPPPVPKSSFILSQKVGLFDLWFGATYAFFAFYQYIVPLFFAFIWGGLQLLLRGMKLEFACFEVVSWWFWFVLFGFIMTALGGVKMFFRLKGAAESYEFNPDGVQYRSPRKQTSTPWKGLTQFQLVGGYLFFKSNGTEVHTLDLGVLGKEGAKALKDFIQKRTPLKTYPLGTILGALFLASAWCIGCGIYEKNTYSFSEHFRNPDAVWTDRELHVAFVSVKKADHGNLYLSILKGMGADKETLDQNVRERVEYHYFRYRDGVEEKYVFANQGLRGSLWPYGNEMYLVDDEGSKPTDARTTAVWKFQTNHFVSVGRSEATLVLESFAKPKEYLECLQWSRWKDFTKKSEEDYEEDEMQNPVTFRQGEKQVSLGWHADYNKDTKQYRTTLTLTGLKDSKGPEILADISSSFAASLISREEYVKFDAENPVPIKGSDE